MKLLKQWLLPVLTCCIAVGAAVLPPRISAARDKGRFGQTYTEQLDADALPAQEPAPLFDRMALYANQYSAGYSILSFHDNIPADSPEGEALAQRAQALLIEGDILPRWIFQEEPFDLAEVTRLLLWDPGSGSAAQGPSAFWEISWSYYADKRHQKSIQLVLDAETEVPLQLYVHDTNMSQWLPYGTKELRAITRQFLALLDVETQETKPDGIVTAYDLNLCYTVSDAPVCFISSRDPTTCSISLEPSARR